MRHFFRVGMELIFSSGLIVSFVCTLQAQPAGRFIENKNQWPADVDFISRIPGGKMAVGSASFTYYFLDYNKLERLHHQGHQPEPDGHGEDNIVQGHTVLAHFVGADAGTVPSAFGRSQEYYNFYIGADRGKWAAYAYAYEGILYSSFYPGIDLKVYAAGENVKYDLIVAPNGDPTRIRIAYEGAERLFLENGNLYIKTSLTDIIEKKPIAWQFVNGEKVLVECAFVLEGDQISFYFPQGFDSCHELVIDPLLIFSTYSGSTADNWGSTATPGEHGNLYSAGVTEEVDHGGKFPATAGAFQTTTAGLYDIGILKYDSLGRDLLYATYLGGSNSESPHSLVMNAAEELIVLGTTSSDDFPATESAYESIFQGGTSTSHVVDYTAGSDIILSRFNRDGTALLASTYVGGSSNDGLNPSTGELTRNYGDQLRGDVISDASGNIYVSSVTASDDLFPPGAGVQPVYQGGATDAVVFKMNPELTQLIWGTYLGGNGTDAAHTLKLDAFNNIFVAGGTSSGNFPVTSGSFQNLYGGGVDGWIAKIGEDGGAILSATFTGTPEYDQIYFLDLNEQEEVYVYGQTAGNFPVSPGVYNNPGSGQFVQKFTNDLSTFIFSTVFGSGRGVPDISPTAFLVNDCNNLYMSGWGGLINTMNGFWTASNSSTVGLPTTPDAFQSTTSGSDFYFIVLTDDAKERLYATFLGGTQSRTHVDGGTSRFDKSGIVYHSVCSGCQSYNAADGATSDFPTTDGAWSGQNRSENCNNAAFKFDLSSLKARLQTNSIKRDMPGLNVVCIPEPIIFDNLSIGGEIFQWDFGDGVVVTRTDTLYVEHKYEAPGDYLVTLKAIDQGTCQVVDFAFTTITVNIAESFVQDDASVCFGDSYALQAGGATEYAWTSDDGKLVSFQPTPVVSPKDTTTYYIRLTEANGCVREDTVRLNVVPAIQPEFEWQKLPDCLSRPRIAVRNLTDSLKGADRLFFDFGDGLTSDNAEEEHFFEKDGVYDIRLVAQREFCVYETLVSVPVFEMFIPNVITPGQSEHNDVFTIRYGETDGVTPGDYGFRVSLSVYNRWGRMVYQADDYQYNWAGEDLAPGIYYYDVTVEGHARCKGWLQVVR